MLLPILDVILELIRPLELSTGLLTVLLGWLLLVRSEFEGLPDELLVVMLLPILDVMLELIRPLELSTGRLTVLRVDELEFDELGRVVICRPSVLEFGAVGVLTDDEMEEGRRIFEELVGGEIVGREIVVGEVVGRDIVDREVMDREVFGRLEELLPDVTLLGVRLDVLRLVVTLLGVRLDVTGLELRLDVVLVERLEDVDWEVDFAAGWLLRFVLLDRLDADITGSAISARIITRSTKNRGWMQYS